VTNDGPKIEIVLGDDITSYFLFVTPVYYIPAPPTTPITSGETTIGSGNAKTNTKTTTSVKSTSTQSSPKTTTQTSTDQTLNTTIQP